MTLDLVATAIASFLLGIGTAHFWILKKLNAHAERLVGHDRDIKTIFNTLSETKKDGEKDHDELKSSMARCVNMHTETLSAMGKLIDQNTILIRIHESK